MELLLDSQSGTQTPPKSVADAGGMKHHLRDKYKTTTSRSATKPAQAPRNAVVSTGTANTSQPITSQRKTMYLLN